MNNKHILKIYKLIIRKTLAGFVAGVFLFNDIAFAGDFQNLATPKGVLQPELQDRFEKGYDLVSNEKFYEFVRAAVSEAGGFENLEDVRPDRVFRAGKRIDLKIAILPNLRENTGVACRLFAGPDFGMPVIFTDNNQDYCDEVLIRKEKIKIRFTPSRKPEGVVAQTKFPMWVNKKTGEMRIGEKSPGEDWQRYTNLLQIIHPQIGKKENKANPQEKNSSNADSADPTILSEGSRVMPRAEHEKKQERLKWQIEEIASALEEITGKLFNSSHAISRRAFYKKRPGKWFFDMRLAAQEILANRSRIPPGNNIFFAADAHNRFTLKIGFGESARDITFELKHINVNPNGKEHRNRSGEKELPMESYNIMEIIDPLFGINHAGRNALTVYARSRRKAVHELAELWYWIKFARQNGVVSRDDIERHELGDKIRLWANTMPRMIVEENTELAHDYACLNEIEFMLNKKASPDTIELVKEKLFTNKRSALKLISDTEAELEITDSDNEWELDVSPDGKTISISNTCLENRSPEFIEHRITHYVNYRQRLYTLMTSDTKLSQSYERDPVLYDWIAKLLCEHMWSEAIARDGSNGLLGVSDLWIFYSGGSESAVRKEALPRDLWLKFIEASFEKLEFSNVRRHRMDIKEARDIRRTMPLLRRKLERNLAAIRLAGPEIDDSVEVDVPIMADTKSTTVTRGRYKQYSHMDYDKFVKLLEAQLGKELSESERQEAARFINAMSGIRKEIGVIGQLNKMIQGGTHPDVCIAVSEKARSIMDHEFPDIQYARVHKTEFYDSSASKHNFYPYDRRIWNIWWDEIDKFSPLHEYLIIKFLSIPLVLELSGDQFVMSKPDPKKEWENTDFVDLGVIIIPVSELQDGDQPYTGKTCRVEDEKLSELVGYNPNLVKLITGRAPGEDFGYRARNAAVRGFADFYPSLGENNIQILAKSREAYVTVDFDQPIEPDRICLVMYSGDPAGIGPWHPTGAEHINDYGQSHRFKVVVPEGDPEYTFRVFDGQNWYWMGWNIRVIEDNKGAFQDRAGTAPGEADAAEKSVENKIALAALELAKKVHDEKFELILMSGGSAPVIYKLFTAAWEKLYGKDYMPEIITLSHEANDALYRNSLSSVRRYCEDIIRSELNDKDGTMLERMRSKRIVYVDDFTDSMTKYKVLKTVFNTLNFGYPVYFAFLAGHPQPDDNDPQIADVYIASRDDEVQKEISLLALTYSGVLRGENIVILSKESVESTLKKAIGFINTSSGNGLAGGPRDGAAAVTESEKTRTVSIGGVTVDVFENVYEPDEEFSASLIETVNKHAGLKGGESVLDIGTGTGIQAINIAMELRKLGSCRVVAIDRKNSAVACAKHNATKNNIRDIVKVIKSEGYEKLAGEKFDLIVANPPVIAIPESEQSIDYDMEDPNYDFINEIINGLPERLTENGRAIIVYSNLLEKRRVIEDMLAEMSDKLEYAKEINTEDVATYVIRLRKMELGGPAIEVLQDIRDNDALLEAAMGAESIAVNAGAAKILSDAGVIAPAAVSGRYKFTDMMVKLGSDGKPEPGYTMKMINAVSGIKYRIHDKEEVLVNCRNVPENRMVMVRELIRMRVINEIDKGLEPVIPEGKILWHIIDNDLISYDQRTTLVTQVNKFFRESNLPERIHIVSGGETIETAISSLRRQCPDSIFTVGFANTAAVYKFPSLTRAKDIRMLVFKGEAENFRQIEGIVAALRSLYLEDSQILPELFHIYRVIGAVPYRGTKSQKELLKLLSQDPAAFALELVCQLPSSGPMPANELPRINKRLREFLIKA